jgi:hypothetical protein
MLIYATPCCSLGLYFFFLNSGSSF